MKFILMFFCVAVLLFAISCDSAESDDPKLPGKIEVAKVSGVTVTSINFYQATIRASISGVSSYSSIEDYGFIYDNISITSFEQGTRVTLGEQDSHAFTVMLKDLTHSTTYYVRAYIVVKGDPILGEENHFDTKGYNIWYSEPISNSPDFSHTEFRGLQLETNGKGYLGYGLKQVGGKNIIPFYEFNPATHALTELPVCPAPYYLYTKRFAAGDKVYLMSGNAIWLYSITGKKWSQLNDFPEGLTPSFGFDYEGEAWVLAEGDDLELRKYDPETDSWTKESIVDVESPLHHFGYGVMVIDDKVYIITAYTSSSPKLVEYTPATDSYRQLTPPPFTLPLGSVTDTYAITTAGSGYFINLASKEIWRYAVPYDSWNKITTPSLSGINMFGIDSILYNASTHLFTYYPD